MFGVGWTEMLLIGVVALIVIGPRDLPVVMNRLGKVVASIRRMGGDFQRELNKATGLDQVTDLRRSITEPLKKTAAEITREFNSVTDTGATVPSGAIVPKDPKAESVVAEIHDKVGMTPPAPLATPAIPAAIDGPAPLEALAPARPSAARKPRAKSAPKAAAASPAEPVARPARSRKAVATAEPVTAEAAPVAPATPKPRKPRAAKPKSEG